MTIEQTVDIPASYRITIDVPREIPVGKAILTLTPATSGSMPADKPNRKHISQYFGILSPNTFGDGVAYQRASRDEWDA